MTGTLKARVGGQWVPVAGSGQDAANVARWNSAWGTVGWFKFPSGSVSVQPGNADFATVSFTAVAGRRYRLHLYISASGRTTAATALTVFVDGVDSGIGGPWHYSATDFENASLQWDLNAVNLTPGPRVITARINNPGVAFSVYRDVFWVEDLGPVTPASIAPPTAGPRVVASGNALGLIARAPFLVNGVNSLPAATMTPFTSPMSATLAVGRRYRIGVFCRAFSSATETIGQAAAVSFTDNGALSSVIDSWVATPFSYGSFHLSGLVDGDGAVHTFVCRAEARTQAATFYGGNGSYAYIEDVGPNTSPALPIPETPPAWSPLTLQNSWISNGTEGTPSYRKIGDIVTLRGAISGGADGTTCCTLPVGFRPAVVAQWAGYMWVTKREIVHLAANPSGAITIAGITSATPQNVSLDVISFSTTP